MLSYNAKGCEFVLKRPPLLPSIPALADDKGENLLSYHPLRIFSGSAHLQLAGEIANILGVALGKSTTRHLPDSEIHVMIDEVVRDQDIFLIQPCSQPVNDNLMELVLYLDAFRRASAHSVSVVIPYFPYSRQERMARGREAIQRACCRQYDRNDGGVACDLY